MPSGRLWAADDFWDRLLNVGSSEQGNIEEKLSSPKRRMFSYSYPKRKQDGKQDWWENVMKWFWNNTYLCIYMLKRSIAKRKAVTQDMFVDPDVHGNGRAYTTGKPPELLNVWLHVGTLVTYESFGATCSLSWWAKIWGKVFSTTVASLFLKSWMYSYQNQIFTQ